MLNKLYISSAILAATVVYDMGRRIGKQTKFSQLQESNELLEERLAMARSQMFYLVTVIDSHDIVLDEFDFIALSNPVY